MSLPTEVMPDHHKHCDGLFVAAEEAVQSGNWAAANPAFERFEGQMHAHFRAEEDLLFPAFESATGMSQGPTQMMRLEHEQMRSLLAEMREACRLRDAEAYGGTAETLLMLMQQHNMKEENILYPMCDRSLGAEAHRIGAHISALLEVAHG